MPLEKTDLEQIGVLIASAVAPLASALSDEALAKKIQPILDAQNKANGVLTKAELDKRDADAKAAAEKAAKDAADAEAKKLADAEAAKKGNKAPEKDPAVAALEATVAELTKKATDAEAATKAERESARTAALYSATKDALVKAGIPADRVHLALPAIKDAGVLAYDGDRPGWKGTDPKTNTAAILDLSAGAAEWIKGDGKHFLPPKDIGGTGDGAGNGGGSGSNATPLRGTDGKLDTNAALNRFLS